MRTIAETYEPTDFAPLTNQIVQNLKVEGYTDPNYDVRCTIGDHDPFGISVHVYVRFHNFVSNRNDYQVELYRIQAAVERTTLSLTRPGYIPDPMCTVLGDECYFGGALTPVLITRGQTIRADDLLSTVHITMRFPNTRSR